MSTRSDSVSAIVAILSADAIAALVSDLTEHLTKCTEEAGDEALDLANAVQTFFDAAPVSKAGAKKNTKAPAKAAPAKPAKAAAKKTAAKAPESDSDEIVVVLNYGPKSHALFGATEANKDKLMSLNPARGDKSGNKKLVGYNQNLAFGPGWTVIDKERLSEVTDLLTAESIPFREIERKEYETETGLGSRAKTAATKPKAAPAKAPAPKTKAAAPKAPATKAKANTAPAKTAAPKSKAGEAPKIVAQKNSWNNLEEAETGIIFLELPVGVAGRNVSVAIGVQDPDAETTVKGLASVLPLSEENVAECENNKWRVLTDEIMATVEKKNKTLHKKLVEMRERVVEEGEAEEEVVEDEEATVEEDDTEGEEGAEGEEGEIVEDE